MRKIYIAGIYQETNTFCPHLTTLENFKQGYYLKRNKVLNYLKNTNTEIEGFLDICNSTENVEAIPGLAAWATASGKVTTETIERIIRELLTDLKKSLPIDGLLLALHGAMVSENSDDCEGYFLEIIRKVLGPDIPIVCTLDYHAVITNKMLEDSDVLVGYQTYPHVDFKQTGQRAAKLLLKLLKNSSRPRLAVRKLPMILPVNNTETDSGPMAEAISKLKQLETDNDIMSCSLFCPHPWLDIESTYITLLSYSNASVIYSCKTFLDDILDSLWLHRKEFFTEYPSIEFVLKSIDEYAKPMIVIDSGDITSAGAPGDSTEILRAIIKSHADIKGVLTIVDPTNVTKAFEIGRGNNASFIIGRQTEQTGYNHYLEINATVTNLDNKKIKLTGPSFAGLEINPGRRARLTTKQGLDIIVSEFKTLTHDPQFLRSIGVEPSEFDLIVQKSHKLFKPAYQDIAHSVITVDTPGITSIRIDELPFQRLRRPIFPLDKISTRQKI